MLRQRCGPQMPRGPPLYETASKFHAAAVATVAAVPGVVPPHDSALGSTKSLNIQLPQRRSQQLRQPLRCRMNMLRHALLRHAAAAAAAARKWLPHAPSTGPYSGFSAGHSSAASCCDAEWNHC